MSFVSRSLRKLSIETPGFSADLIRAATVVRAVNIGRAALAASVLPILLVLSIPEAASARQGPKKFVSGYYTNHHAWAYPPEAVDFEALTHILHFSVDVIDTPPYLNILSSTAATNEWETAGTGRNITRDLIDQAHAHGTKVSLSVANVNYYGGNNAVMSYVVGDSVRCQTFVDAALAYCRLVGYDGIDINWEWPTYADREGYSRMMRMFRRGMDAWPVRGTLSHTIYVLMGNRPGPYGAYDVELLNQYADQHNMECYGLGFQQSNRRLGYTFALSPAVQTIEVPGGYYDAISLTDPDHNTDAGYNTGPAGAVVQGWAREKIGVGVGFLYYYVMSSQPLLIGGTNTGSWQNYYRFYYGDIIGTKPGQFGAYPRQWNDETKAPYKRWQTDSTYHFVSYEDSLSLAWKARSIIDSGYGGMMIYELATGHIDTDGGLPWSVPGYSGGKDPLLESIRIEMGMTGSNADIVPPVVTLGSAFPGGPATGTVQLVATASDDRGNPRVVFTVDGNSVGPTLHGPPYQVSWNSASVPNGPHLVRATATDGWGNQSYAEATVDVLNERGPGDTIRPTPAGVLALFGDGLNAGWVDHSWGAVNTFNSTEQVKEGSTSIRTAQDPWGGLMLRAGTISAPADFDPTPYEFLRFSVYPTNPDLSLNVTFENVQGEPFAINVISGMPAAEWTDISIPVENINTLDLDVVHNLIIQNWTSADQTYFIDEYVFVDTTSADPGDDPATPRTYSLSQNYPNPFNPKTTIDYSLARASQVRIEVFDILGRLIAVPVSSLMPEGDHTFVWTALGNDGHQVPTGVYTYRLIATPIDGSSRVVSESRKMVLVR